MSLLEVSAYLDLNGLFMLLKCHGIHSDIKYEQKIIRASHYALYSGSFMTFYSLVPVLKEHKLLDQKDDEGSTLLHNACKTFVSFKFVLALVLAEANIEIVDNENKNAFEMACATKQRRKRNYLL